MSDHKNTLRIMIAAGGTGGHVFPAIAIADAIRKAHPDARFLFVGTRDRMEWKAVPAAGYDIAPIWISGFHRRLTLKNLLFPIKLLVSLWQSWKLIKKFRPHAMVSCGGFASGPAGWVAARMSVPLFLQEQNSYPGVTNRQLASRAEQIFTAFENAGKWFPEEKTLCVGNPVRNALVSQVNDPDFVKQSLKHFGFDPSRPVVLVMGGSGGAKSINEAMVRHVDELHNDDGMQIIWQCGESYLEEITKQIFGGEAENSPGNPYPGLRIRGFMNDIAEAWAVAGVIVSRAGATTCAELLATGKAGILVPSPWVAGDHQTHNAKALADNGAAVLLKDDELGERLPEAIRSLIGDPSRRKTIEAKAAGLAKNDAASVIAEHILDHVRQAVAFRSAVGHRQTVAFRQAPELRQAEMFRQTEMFRQAKPSRSTAAHHRISQTILSETQYSTATA